MQCFNLAIHTYMWPLSSNHCVDFHFCSLSADIIDYVIICYIFAVLCVLYTCLKKIAKVRSNKIVVNILPNVQDLPSPFSFLLGGKEGKNQCLVMK